MASCNCSEEHAERRRIVVTGGPGAGKTAALELIRQTVCAHVRILPEAAGIVFGGGFPREPALPARRAAQRAIFYVQRELEAASETEQWPIHLCDRGTIDGAAYWPSGDDLFESVGTTLGEQLLRYDTVIHMRTPSLENGYHNRNPLRLESAVQARAIDQRIAELWADHRQRWILCRASHEVDCR